MILEIVSACSGAMRRLQSITLPAARNSPVASSVEVRLQGGVEVGGARGFAGLGCWQRHDTWSRLTDTRALLSRRHAGFTSPGWRPSAAISADERALTTLPSPAAANCLAASMALPATTKAALKYLNDGASGRVAPIHSTPRVADSVGMTIWTTQPAGGDFSVMVRTCAHRIELVQFGPKWASADNAGLGLA